MKGDAIGEPGDEPTTAPMRSSKAAATSDCQGRQGSAEVGHALEQQHFHQ